MSIARQSQRPNSELCRFLDRYLPRRRDLVDRWRVQLRAEEVELHPGDARVLGLALEIRIGLDIAERPVHEGLLGFLPAEQCLRLLQACGFRSEPELDGLAATRTDEPMARFWVRSERPAADDDGQREALRAVLTLASIENLGLRAEPLPVQRRRRLLAQIIRMGPWQDGLRGRLIEPFERLWRRYVCGARDALLGLGERVLVAPTIVPQFARADLVIGSTLIEIKVSADPVRELDRWLDQLLGYALIDTWDSLWIRQLALYCGWQTAVLRVDLDEVLQNAAPRGKWFSLDALRERLHNELRSALEDANRRFQAQQFKDQTDAVTATTRDLG